MRMAKSCGPDASTLASSFAVTRDDGDKQARSPGRARRKPLKPLRAGMPGESGEPTVTMLVCFFILHARLRVLWAPGIPHALLSFGRTIMQDSGAFASRECGGVSQPSLPATNAMRLRTGA